MLSAIVSSILFFFLQSPAIAGVDMMLGVGGDRSYVEDGAGIEASNNGLSGQTALAFSFFEPLYIGGFYYRGEAKTSDVSSGENVDNFHFSAIGYGAELGLRFYSVMLKLGIGSYEAEARKVQDKIGRTYTLSGGQGFHFGIEKRFSLSPATNWFIGVYTRDINYSQIKIKSGSDDYADLPSSWQQRIYSLFVGIVFNFDVFSEEKTNESN